MFLVGAVPRLDDGPVAIGGGRAVVAPRRAGLVVPADAAPDAPPEGVRWPRGRPAQLAPITSKAPKIQCTGGHALSIEAVKIYSPSTGG